MGVMGQSPHAHMRNLSLFCGIPWRIPGDLPQMPIRILKVSRIPAPKAVVRRVGDFGSGLLCLLHNRIDRLFGSDVVPDPEFGNAGRSHRHMSILGQGSFRVKCEHEILIHVKEGNGPVREFGPFDTFCRQSQAIAVKGKHGSQRMLSLLATPRGAHALVHLTCTAPHCEARRAVQVSANLRAHRASLWEKQSLHLRV